MLFTELNLNPSVMRGIEDAGFTECTPVQASTFQKSLAGTDVMVQSQTGTGKTAAFLITIFNLFLTGENYRHKRALVLTPTRELAVQVEQDARVLGKHCGLKIGCFYGGVGYATQDQLLRGDLNLYIGTPGRLIDYQKSGKIDFLKFEILVIDEADRMFDMGFIPDIRYMLKRMVPADRRLTMLYSATLDQRVKHLAWEYMNEPVEIEIDPEHLTVDLITQELYHVGREEKFNLLLGILRAEKPKSVLIFTNMKRTAERVSRRLAANGVKNDYISGDLPQKKRLKIIDAIKHGKTEILVATDVAGRGLHIEDLDMVINYDLPDDNQNYVHRIGRTARAGKSGKAISLASEEDVYNLAPIEKLIGMKIPVKWADENLIVEATGAPIHGRREPRGERRAARPGERRRDRQDRDRNRPSAKAPQRDHAKSDSGGETRQTRAKAGEQRQDSRQKGQRPAQAPSPEKGAADAGAQQARNKRRRRRGKKPQAETAAPRAPQAKPEKDRKHDRKHDKKRKPGISRDATPEERLEYFRKKYGDNFEKSGRVIGGDQKTKPKTLVQGIRSMFDKMKKKKD
ncbi:MAG: DEAD/DEAH box helicase [Spirochaetes bacterium]|nr:DEAD/DEAH box helicase [Spirochaetota bacterium]